MSFLSPRLQLKVSQKQILTPGLVQMVTVLQLNRLELKEMITQEIVKNPVLEEATEEAGEEITPEELLPLLEAEATSDPADRQILDATPGNQTSTAEGERADVAINGNLFPDPEETAAVAPAEPEAVTAGDPPTEPAAADPFDEIDFGSFFDDYLDPGYKSPAAESVEKPSFETFLSAPVTLGDYLRSQLAVVVMPDAVRDAAEAIIGNLDEDGYLTASLEEIAPLGEHQARNRGGGAGSRAVARSGRRRRARFAGVPAAADRKRQRPRRRRLADRLQPHAPARNPPVQGDGAAAGTAHRAHRDRRLHDPPPQSAARPALFRSRRAGGRAGRLPSSRTATNTSSR